MMNFSPADWIEIGSSLIAAFFGLRLFYMLAIGMMGFTEPEPQSMNIDVRLHIDEPQEDDE
jgi:hypothetical protein